MGTITIASFRDSTVVQDQHVAHVLSVYSCSTIATGQLVGKRAGLVVERLRVRIPAGAAGEFSSPGLTLCADSYSVSLLPPYYRSST